MEAKAKIPTTVYLSSELRERLEMYCLLSKRFSRTKIFTEALAEYLNSRLQSEHEKQGDLK